MAQWWLVDGGITGCMSLGLLLMRCEWSGLHEVATLPCLPSRRGLTMATIDIKNAPSKDASTWYPLLSHKLTMKPRPLNSVNEFRCVTVSRVILHCYLTSIVQPGQIFWRKDCKLPAFSVNSQETILSIIYVEAVRVLILPGARASHKGLPPRCPRRPWRLRRHPMI